MPRPISPSSAQDVQQKLEQVAGVSRVTRKDSKDGSDALHRREPAGQHVRPELARAVVESGWHLNELHGVGLSLEEIFLELTAVQGTHRLQRRLRQNHGA